MVLVQGGAGESGAVDQVAPPPPQVTLDSGPARGHVDPPEASPAGPALSLRAVSLAEGEATVELDGRRQVVRPGLRLGDDTVKSVSEERLVLARPSRPGEGRGDILVVVTFDAEGNGRTRVFWAVDPETPASPEVKRP